MSQLYPFCPLLCGQRTNSLLEHIEICKNKSFLNIKYFQCPYNPIHIFGIKAYEKHIKNCPDLKNKIKEDKSLEKSIENENKEKKGKIFDNEKDKMIETENKETLTNEEELLIFEDGIENEEKEEIKTKNEKNNIRKRSIYRSNTSTFSNKYNKNISLTEIFSENERKLKRKNSDSLDKYKEHIKEHSNLLNDEFDILKENLSKVTPMSERGFRTPEKKIFSSSNLKMKGILKNKFENYEENNLIRKCASFERKKPESNPSSFRNNINSSTNLSFRYCDEENSVSSFIDSEISEEENILKRKKQRRLSCKTVSFKGFVKVFVFNGNNGNSNSNNNQSKIQHKRSGFSKFSNINNTKDESKELKEVYMKVL